ncbi:3-hydroxyisobutyrate dehydrogenase, partial [Pseudoalteromonas aliena]
MGSMAKNLYTMLQHQGAVSDDFSAIFKLFSK